MARYLRATGRSGFASFADANIGLLRADDEVERDPSAHFDKIVEIDLSNL